MGGTADRDGRGLRGRRHRRRPQAAQDLRGRRSERDAGRHRVHGHDDRGDLRDRAGPGDRRSVGGDGRGAGRRAGRDAGAARGQGPGAGLPGRCQGQGAGGRRRLCRVRRRQGVVLHAPPRRTIAAGNGVAQPGAHRRHDLRPEERPGGAGVPAGGGRGRRGRHGAGLARPERGLDDAGGGLVRSDHRRTGDRRADLHAADQAVGEGTAARRALQRAHRLPAVPDLGPGRALRQRPGRLLRPLPPTAVSM
ncbi:hypothetical protein SBRY_20559 [Actinacidiphila bryophytorum]|uniref:Uncharacterized protein n=1 Tax=Actinacidiphila bryophytorum TaxID=1436133 RepID=A0A9W4E9W9_9ACTN|nr:hypothetical protein SBRY_20559 [Actinacidiphila bryophytorum]